MKKIAYFLALSAVIFSCGKNTNSNKDSDSFKQITLKKYWVSDSLETPESVIYDSDRNILYVSCIGGVPPDKHDGDGYLAKLDLNGKILNKEWIRGLDAPKGMGIYNNTLYVTDIDKLVIINLNSDQIENKISLKNAQFLNDISISKTGDVYFTDSNTSTIYFLNGDDVEVFIQDNSLGGTNGILFNKEDLYTVGFKSGNLFEINKANKSFKKIADSFGGGDGIAKFKNNLLVSDWNGQVFQVNPITGNSIKILDTKEQKENAADIEVIESKNLLLVPTFFGNTVTAYNLE